MKLGEMLIRDGCVSAPQLERALARQAQEGGRLGTILVEMGLIDADTVTVYLGLELGIPIATGATLERAKRTAVRLLTPAQARQFRCIPIIVQDRQIIAALDDPHDLEVLDELYRLTGYRILPRVAPEIRIFYYLERYYGIPRPQRLAALGDSVRGRAPSQAAAARLPAPPLPGLPPVTASPAPQPEAQPVTMRPTPMVTSAADDSARGQANAAAADSAGQAPAAASTGDAGGEAGAEGSAGPPSAEGRALASDAEELVITLEADGADPAEEAQPLSFDAVELSSPETAAEPEPDFQPMTAEEVKIALAEASRRGDVADALMAYAVSVFDTTALCVMRDNMAFGWKASGGSLDRERIEALLVPLDIPSMFQNAMHKDNLFHGPPMPSTLHTYLYRVLRCQPPAQAVVAVVSIGKRVVNFLYGHCEREEAMDEAEIAALRDVCQAASNAYVRLIAASKRESGEPLRERKPARLITIDPVAE